MCLQQSGWLLHNLPQCPRQSVIHPRLGKWLEDGSFIGDTCIQIVYLSILDFGKLGRLCDQDSYLVVEMKEIQQLLFPVYSFIVSLRMLNWVSSDITVLVISVLSYPTAADRYWSVRHLVPQKELLLFFLSFHFCLKNVWFLKLTGSSPNSVRSSLLTSPKRFCQLTASYSLRQRTGRLHPPPRYFVVFICHTSKTSAPNTV